MPAFVTISVVEQSAFALTWVREVVCAWRIEHTANIGMLVKIS